MTQTPRVRVAKPGKSIFSSDVRDFRFDERYAMFKYHSTTNTTVTLNGGDTEKSSTVSHALGYVPAFIAYYKRSDESVWRILPDIPYGVGFDMYPWAYATTTGVTVGYTSANPYNMVSYSFSDYWSSFDNLNDHWSAGKTSFGFGGAFRFTGIALNKNQSISAAAVEVGVTAKGASAGDIKMKHYGIDEDNTGNFSSDPMGRSKTTAVTTQNHSPATPNYNFSFDVKAQVEEIIARNNWASGNAIGFITNDNGSADNVWVVARNSTNTLFITKSGSLTVSFRVIIFKDKIA